MKVKERASPFHPVSKDSREIFIRIWNYLGLESDVEKFEFRVTHGEGRTSLSS